jgi:hypothetical protein
MKIRNRLLAALLLLTLLACLVGCGAATPQSGSTNATVPGPSPAEVKLASDLDAFLAAPDPAKITGTKAVTLLIDTEHSYETSIAMELTPEDLRTTNMGEVRYFIRCYESVEVVGQYTSGGAIADAAYQWRQVFQIVDLLENGVLASKEFLGSEPKETIMLSENSYGTKPDPAQIHEWVSATIEKGEFTNQHTLHVKLPEGWILPAYVTYTDSENLMNETVSTYLLPRGQWHTVKIPNWAENIYVTGNLVGNSDGRKQKITGTFAMDSKDLWLVIHDLEGNYELYDHEPTE